MPEGATGPGEVSTIILAAGEGKRMRSATPKVLHRLAGRSLVEHAVRAAAGLAPQRMAVVVGHGREAVTEHLHELAKVLGDDTAATVTVAVQEEQHGTGHAVRCALDELPGGLSGTVLVTYGDVPLLDTATLSALLAEHTKAGNAVTVLTAELDDPTGYGRIVRAADGSVEAIVEQKDASTAQAAIREINSGVYAFDAAVLADALGRLSTDNAQGEQYLTDVLGIARDGGHRVGSFGCADRWLVEGVNDRVQLAALGAELNRRLTERWMREGVTMTDPSTVWLDAGVELARDVVLEPNVQLRGATTAGEGAVIGPDTTLTDVRIGAGARIVRTHGGEAEIGDGANVGPYAYLRPGTVLHESGKIGTFVEVKNSEIGRGTKVPHLSYVGDATIGEYSNIGAASVFVNYDGVTKRRSTVGSYARTGCDNMFVAPVSVGDGAYTGAGAVLRQDVPPGALAVSAGVQRNIDGWVQHKRPGTPAAEAARRALESAAAEEES